MRKSNVQKQKWMVAASAFVLIIVLLISAGLIQQERLIADAADGNRGDRGIVTTVTGEDTTNTNTDINARYQYVLDNAPEQFGYQLLDYIVKTCDEYNVNPDMMFGLFYVESGFNPGADNPNSSARGLGQILKGTGEYVYSVLLGKEDTYTHDMAYNGYLNAEMSIAVMHHYLEISNGDIHYAMNKYSGTRLGTNYYYNRVLSFLQSCGVELTTPYYK